MYHCSHLFCYFFGYADLRDCQTLESLRGLSPQFMCGSPLLFVLLNVIYSVLDRFVFAHAGFPFYGT